MISKGAIMRVFIVLLLFLLIALLITPITVLGQNVISRVYILEDGIFSFNHDQPIAVTIVSNATSLTVGEFFISDSTQPNLRVQVSRPTLAADFARVGFGDTPASILASRLRLWQQTAPNQIASVIGTLPNGTFSSTPIQSFLVNDLSAASANLTFTWDTQTAATFIAVLDVGSQHVVTLVASPALGDANTILSAHQANITTLINSVRYTPNAGAVTIQPLPLTYLGEIGRLRTGMLTFTYPKDWYILPVGGNILITNTNQLAINQLLSGQVQTQIIPPDFNLTAFADRDQIINCAIGEDTLAQITPLAVIERQMLNPERLRAYQADGVTYIAPQTTIIADRTIAYMMLFTPDRDAFVLAVDLGMGNIVSLMAFSAPNEMTNYTTTLFSIAASFRYDTNACADLSARDDL